MADTTSSGGKSSVYVTALDGLVHVNSLFSGVVFLGLSFSSSSSSSSSTSSTCTVDETTVKRLVLFEITSFSCFLFSTMVAYALKLALHLLHCKGHGSGPSTASIHSWVLRFGVMLIAFSSWLGGDSRGQGWKYGSGFVDGVFPVLNPIAKQIVEFMKEERDADRVYAFLDQIPATHTSWDDIVNVAIYLRLSKLWDPIALVRGFSFQPSLGWLFLGIKKKKFGCRSVLACLDRVPFSFGAGLNLEFSGFPFGSRVPRQHLMDTSTKLTALTPR
ncbi:uncharacterized protein LOC116215687 isoform X2 [Punica granatum]|uniref:Uncharacterized protein LOC116215687 isoform X2 n=1 Tax=Punica granatum TaxID=22663 RepID=A0A6P8EKZ1_PUNGR|nr:uncharacterized protein LOC116215687 isoform X2 [Punica granatum]